MPNTFKDRFWKYTAAMEACPTARFAELVPLSSLITRRGILYDLMGGDGFVSQHLGVGFDQSYLIDQCSIHFPKYDRTRTKFINADVSQVDLRELDLPPADTMACLAGFHHLPWKQSDQSADDVGTFRTGVLESWGRCLKKGGRLIISDVAGSDEDSLVGQLSDKLCAEALSGVTALNGVDVDSSEFSPEPDKFLNVFVHHETAGGHDCKFETTVSLKKKLITAGFTNVDARVYYTPWVFYDKLSAIKFIARLFGIGDEPPVSLQGDLLAAGIKTEEAINKYLGLTPLEDGRCVVHWKLLYAWGDRCDD